METDSDIIQLHWRTGMHKGTWHLRDESLEISRQACKKANEETYPSPLLVNIKLIQPYRE